MDIIRTGKDEIIKGMAFNNEIRYFAAYTRDVVEEARAIHDTWPVCTAALGRTLTAGAMMGTMCKNDTDVLSVIIKGDGPAKGVTVTANANAEVKGLIYNPEVDLPINKVGHLDVGGAIGRGYVSVIKDLGMKEPYVGQTQLISGEIAEDLTYYFAVSEQVPTSVGLGVLVNKEETVEHAGGFIIQVMPFASDETITKLEDCLKGISSVTDYFVRGLSPEEMMHEILGDDFSVEERIVPKYLCDCSEDRMRRALISVGVKDIKEMIEEGKPVTMRCDFCNSEYTFGLDELQKIVDEAEAIKKM